MTREEFDQLNTRLTEINQEIAALMPEFLQAGGSMHQAQVDAAIWAARLDPLFKEHASIAQRLRAAAIPN